MASRWLFRRHFRRFCFDPFSSRSSAQKPLTRATQRDPQKIAAWLEQDYPSIAARAKRERAVIYWSDETGVNN